MRTKGQQSRRWRVFKWVFAVGVVLCLVTSVIPVLVELGRTSATLPPEYIEFSSEFGRSAAPRQSPREAERSIALMETETTTPTVELKFAPFIPADFAGRLGDVADELNREFDRMRQMIAEFESDRSRLDGFEMDRRRIAIEWQFGDATSKLLEHLPEKYWRHLDKLCPEMHANYYDFHLWNTDAKRECMERQGDLIEAARFAHDLRGLLSADKIREAEASDNPLEYDELAQRIQLVDEAAWQREAAYLRSSGSAKGYALFAWRTIERRGDGASRVVFHRLNRSWWREHMADVRMKRDEYKNAPLGQGATEKNSISEAN